MKERQKDACVVGAVCCNHSPNSSHSAHTPHPKLGPPADPPTSATPRISFPLSLHIQNTSPLFPCATLSITHPYNACNHPVLLHPLFDRFTPGSERLVKHDRKDKLTSEKKTIVARGVRQ